MARIIQCRETQKNQAQSVRVRIIKAPLVDSEVLCQVISQRQKAVMI